MNRSRAARATTPRDLANAGIPSAMIFVRNENGSHNPHEAMTIDDFMKGVAVMRDVLAEEAAG